ncbi:MAG: DUF523 domain-containing protein [Gammaproteobacteria bacterium]|nr:DUF523 domain-containing protein [Gammaproteobacteria bacterium]
MQPSRILVSACLLGEPVRYDGRCKELEYPQLDELLKQDRVIGFCPEVAGGLPVPRDAAEIQTGDGYAVLDKLARVISSNGRDVTDCFLQGAHQALALCRQHAIRVAVLTELSPSCGSSQIYDGSFNRIRIHGVGVTTALLERHGISVFNPSQIGDAINRLNRVD